MKLKSLALYGLLSLFSVNPSFSQDFYYKYKLYVNPILIGKSVVGEAWVKKEDNTIEGMVRVKEDINLRLKYNFETKQYFEYEKQISIKEGTQCVLTAYQKFLSYLRDDSFGDKEFNLTIGLNQNNHKKDIKVFYQNITKEGLLKFRVEDFTGDIGIEDIVYMEIYYSQRLKNIKKIYAVRKGPKYNLMGILK